MALTVVALLPVGYVGAWLMVSRANYEGLFANPTAAKIAPVFAPIVNHCHAQRPGCRLLSQLWWKVNPPQEVQAGGMPFLTSPTAVELRPPHPMGYTK
jgi:hypothetical protein